MKEIIQLIVYDEMDNYVCLNIRKRNTVIYKSCVRENDEEKSSWKINPSRELIYFFLNRGYSFIGTRDKRFSKYLRQMSDCLNKSDIFRYKKMIK